MRLCDRADIRHLPEPVGFDAVIASAAGRPADQIDPVLLDLLRLGTYHCCAPTWPRTQRYPRRSSRRVSNSIRREPVSSTACCEPSPSVTTGVDIELAPSIDTDPVGHLAFTHAHPRWIAQAFTDALGNPCGRVESALAADNARPGVHLAARPGVLTGGGIGEAVQGTVGRYSPHAVHPAAVTRTVCRGPGRQSACSGRGQPAGRTR